MSVLRGVVLGLVLVAANGFFVAVEFALLAARRSKVEALVAEGRPGARSALAGMRSLNFQLAASQLGITVMSLLLGWWVEPVVGGALEHVVGMTPLPERTATAVGFAVGLVLVALVHMVLGEMVPKSLALAHPEGAASVLAPVHRVVSAAVRPVVVVLYGVARAGTRLLGVDPTDELVEAHTLQELAVLLDESLDEGQLRVDERDRLAGAIEFLGRRAVDVMTPLASLSTVGRSATVAEAEAQILDSGWSRLLVTADGDPTDAVGLVHVKDLLLVDPAERDRPLPDRVVRRVLQVDGRLELDDVLREIRLGRSQFVVVVDRSGPGRPALLGALTVEDLVEQIFGAVDRDMADGADPAEPTGPSGGAA